jgi:hypothetical protein
MTKFFLALIAMSAATLIVAFVIVAFRPHNPLLHRPPSLREAPSDERTLMPPPESDEPSGSPAGRFWPGVDYPAISANRADGRRLLTFQLDSDFGDGDNADQNIDGWSVGLAGSIERPIQQPQQYVIDPPSLQPAFPSS